MLFNDTNIGEGPFWDITNDQWYNNFCLGEDDHDMMNPSLVTERTAIVEEKVPFLFKKAQVCCLFKFVSSEWKTENVK